MGVLDKMTDVIILGLVAGIGFMIFKGAHDIVSFFGGFKMPNITMPNITMPTITMPNITMPTITMPNITMPTITMPDIKWPPNLLGGPDGGHGDKSHDKNQKDVGDKDLSDHLQKTGAGEGLYNVPSGLINLDWVFGLPPTMHGGKELYNIPFSKYEEEHPIEKNQEHKPTFREFEETHLV